MKTLKFVLGLVLLCLFYAGVSQNNTAPVIVAGDIPAVTILNESEYEGKSLWGYINGGADLYLEYGFSKLLVQEIEWNDILLKANIYQMMSEEAAYGIFSVNVHKCKKRDVLKEFDCQGSYQYQVFAGKYYISVVNETGKPEAEEASKDLAEILLKKIPDSEPEYPGIFLNTPFKDQLGKIKFINGRLGLQNGFPDWGNYFDGLNNYSAWLLPLEDAVLAYIGFKSKEDADLFLKKMNAGTVKKSKSWEINDKALIVLKSLNDSDSEKHLQVVEDYISKK